jgi:hypothetical protein
MYLLPLPSVLAETLVLFTVQFGKIISLTLKRNEKWFTFLGRIIEVRPIKTAAIFTI